MEEISSLTMSLFHVNTNKETSLDQNDLTPQYIPEFPVAVPDIEPNKEMNSFQNLVIPSKTAKKLLELYQSISPHLYSFYYAYSLSLSLSLSFFFFSFFSLLLQKDLSLSPLLMCLLSIPNVSVSLVPFLKIFCFVCVYSFHLFFRIPR